VKGEESKGRKTGDRRQETGGGKEGGRRQQGWKVGRLEGANWTKGQT